MPVPIQYRGRYAYHFCHLDNLPGVLRHGLLSCNEQAARGIQHTSIAEQSIQARRAVMPVTCGPGGVVHDYVPFYLCQRSSMFMAVVQAKNIDQQMLVHLAVPIKIVERNDVVFSSASANTIIPPQFYADPERLVDLDWNAIRSQAWSMPTDAQKQARMAEVLVHRHLPIAAVSHIIVWNAHFRDEVIRIYQEADLEAPRIEFDSHHYLTPFWMPEPDKRHSLITGPRLLLAEFQSSTDQVVEAIGKNANPEFKNLWELRDRLRGDFGCLECTAEIIGLATENAEHHEDVGDHTLRVVRTLRNLPEFQALRECDQLLTEIAAYLHDVGKGPKARWAWNKGKQKADPDHPARAIPMTVGTLQQVGTMKPRSARVILLLVAYHDLIGEITGKKRNESQLYEVIRTERELRMLVALSKADVLSLNAHWWDEDKVQTLITRTLNQIEDQDD